MLCNEAQKRKTHALDLSRDVSRMKNTVFSLAGDHRHDFVNQSKWMSRDGKRKLGTLFSFSMHYCLQHEPIFYARTFYYILKINSIPLVEITLKTRLSKLPSMILKDLELQRPVFVILRYGRWRSLHKLHNKFFV